MHQEGKIVGVLLLLATLSALWFVFNFFDFKVLDKKISKQTAINF